MIRSVVHESCIENSRSKYRKFKARPPDYSGGSALERMQVGIWAQWRTVGAVGVPVLVSDARIWPGGREKDVDQIFYDPGFSESLYLIVQYRLANRNHFLSGRYSDIISDKKG